MPLSRRQMIGGGLFGAAALTTGAGLFVRDHPGALLGLGKRPVTNLWGFVGGEKQKLLANPKLIAALAKEAGLSLDPRQAGSVEMVREQSLLSQKPQFLWHLPM